MPLAHLVREFQQGEPPEAIRSHYPTLSLEQVYGAITFYLGHKDEGKNDIAERKRVEDEFTKTHPTPPHLKEKLQRARQLMLARRSSRPAGRPRMRRCRTRKPHSFRWWSARLRVRSR